MNWQEAGSWVWYFCCLGSSWLEDIDIVFQSLLPSHTQTEFPWNYFPNIVVPKRHVWLCLCRILKWKSVFFCLYIFEIPSQCYAMMGCQNLNILLCWLEGHYIGRELFEPPSLKIHWRETTDKQHRFVSAINWDTLLKIGLARPRHGCAPTDFLSEIWVLSWVRNAHHSFLLFADHVNILHALWALRPCDLRNGAMMG